MLDKIFDKTVPGLHKAMDLAWKRNNAIASNIANAETPQYRAMDLNFAGELEKAFSGDSSNNLMMTNSKHMELKSEGKSFLEEDLSGATKPDGNNVDLDIQMGKLMKNSGEFNTAASILRKKLRMTRMAIRFAER
ncbi:MAG: flagellar basal body rod protein FlgB [Deltaproteobacteria bacterium]|nr:flagellar basal body rod protein FlgB [Deltaproteobacteria bacterium]